MNINRILAFGKATSEEFEKMDKKVYDSFETEFNNIKNDINDYLKTFLGVKSLKEVLNDCNFRIKLDFNIGDLNMEMLLKNDDKMPYVFNTKLITFVSNILFDFLKSNNIDNIYLVESYLDGDFKGIQIDLRSNSIRNIYNILKINFNSEDFKWLKQYDLDKIKSTYDLIKQTQEDFPMEFL